MTTQADIDRALNWARSQNGKPYVLGGAGTPGWDCSGFMSAVQRVLMGREPGRMWTTYPFHSGSYNPEEGWYRDFNAPFKIGITSAGIGHVAGTLDGVNIETRGHYGTIYNGLRDPHARGYDDPLFMFHYGFKPSITVRPGTTADKGEIMTAIYFSHVKYGLRNPDIVVYQKALIAHKQSIPAGATGYFGDQTKAATRHFQLAQGWSGDGANGVPGPLTFARLGLTNKASSTTSSSGSTSSGEPAANYAKTYYGGKLVNERTRILLERAAKIHGSSLRLAQGSYNTSVSASAGTHAGGGAADVVPADWALAKILRRVGFCAWVRTPAEGPWGYHIHCIAIGDRQMSAAAHHQVIAYFSGRNGLANNRADTAPSWVGRPYPAWAAKYK